MLSYPLAKCSGQRGSNTLDLIGVRANCIVLYCPTCDKLIVSLRHVQNVIE